MDNSPLYRSMLWISAGVTAHLCVLTVQCGTIPTRTESPFSCVTWNSLLKAFTKPINSIKYSFKLKGKESWEPPLKLKSFSVHIISPQTKHTAHQHLFYPRRSSFPVTMKEGEYSAGWGWNWETDLGAGALVFPKWFKIPVESHKVNKSIYQLQ